MIDRLDELNRILAAILVLTGSGPESLVPVNSVIRLCQETVREGRYPNHEVTVQFASELQLLTLENNSVRLTRTGLDFMRLNPHRYYELTSEQIIYLTRNHYLGGCFATECKKAFKSFVIDGNSSNLSWSEFDNIPLIVSPWLISHLCQLRLIKRTLVGYKSTPEMAPTLLQFIEEPKGLTEERLRELLLEKEAIGSIGEELAMVFERSRLQSLSHMVEAHCIKRISAIRVNAGYDIESFDARSPTGIFDRFIEVKASRGKNLRFFWTENEIKIAEKLRHRYWIYFFGGIDSANRIASQKPILFQDPYHSIMNNTDLIKTFQGMIVHGKLREEDL